MKKWPCCVDFLSMNGTSVYIFTLCPVRGRQVCKLLLDLCSASSSFTVLTKSLRVMLPRSFDNDKSFVTNVFRPYVNT